MEANNALPNENPVNEDPVNDVAVNEAAVNEGENNPDEANEEVLPQQEQNIQDVELCYINEFPDKLIMKILVHLSPYVDTKNARLVNKKWLRLITVIEEQNRETFLKAMKTHNIMWQINKTQRYGIKDVPLPGSADHMHISRPTVSVPSARFSHVSVILGHYMYLFGGANSDDQKGTTYNDLFRLDLSNYKWQKILADGLLPAPREAATIVAYKEPPAKDLYNTVPFKGKLVLHAGVCRPPYERQHTMVPRFYEDTQVFDIHTSTWTMLEWSPGTPYPSARGAHSASVVGNMIVMFGGAHRNHKLNDVWVFNLETFRWSMVHIRGKRPVERFGQMQFTISEERILVIGGCEGGDDAITDVWLLDTNLWSWTSVRVDNQICEPPRLWCHSPVMVNGDIIAFSDGKICPYCYNFIEMYTVPKSSPEPGAEDCMCGRKMSERKPRPKPRAEPTETIYLQMYTLDCSNLLTTLSCEWLDYHYLTPSPLSKRHFTACVGINEIVVFGGIEESGAHKVNDCMIVVAAKPSTLP